MAQTWHEALQQVQITALTQHYWKQPWLLLLCLQAHITAQAHIMLLFSPSQSNGNNKLLLLSHYYSHWRSQTRVKLNFNNIRYAINLAGFLSTVTALHTCIKTQKLLSKRHGKVIGSTQAQTAAGTILTWSTASRMRCPKSSRVLRGKHR